MFIEFENIPSSNKLFLDYITDFVRVEKFFRHSFLQTNLYDEHFNNLASRERKHRYRIFEIIKSQYQNYAPSQITESNINALQSRKTFAIVTGQQIGIFGGHLYTFYKIMTAIKLASKLQEEFKQFNFVPMFWLEADDHDFDEIRTFNIIDNNNSLRSISYNDELPEETNRGSVGNLLIDKNIDDVFNELKSSITDTDFKESILKELNSIYSKGKAFKQAFRELIFALFDKYGLIIFDPQNKGVKKILQPIFEKEIENFRKHMEDIIRTSALLDENYHAQVKVNPINIFITDEDGRFLLEPAEDKFRLRTRRKTFTKEELLAQLNFYPENFSPNVLLRPICQDYLLPTAFYVAGPSEICYFAQVIPLYEYFDILRPIIYPRSSVTIIESGIAKLLEKFSLNYLDIFHNKKYLFDKVLSSASEPDYNTQFVRAKDGVENILNDLREELIKLDKTLNDSVYNTQQKIFHSLDILKLKVDNAYEKKHEIIIRQLNKIKELTYPDDDLQERKLNYIYFANKYGKDFLDIIFEQIVVGKCEHQIIELS